MAGVEDVQFNNDLDDPGDTDNEIPAADSTGKEPGETTPDAPDATDHETLSADSNGEGLREATSGNDVIQSDEPQDQISNSRDSMESGGSQQQQTSKSSVTSVLNWSSQEHKSDSNISSRSESGFCGNAFPVGPGHGQTPDLKPLAELELAKQDKTLESTVSIENDETPGGQASETLTEKENVETQQDKFAESISRDEKNRSLHTARTFEPITLSMNERNPEGAASMPDFSGVRECGVIVKKDADDNTDRLYHEKVIREIQSLKTENSEFESCCKEREQNVDALFSKLNETGIRQKNEEELYHSLQDEIIQYGMRCDFESGKVSVLAKQVTVIIEETTVGLEVTPASINILEQELTRLTKLIENKREQYNNYLKLLKDHDSKMRLSLAEEETRLRKELQTEMAEKEKNFAEKETQLRKELECLKAEMIGKDNNFAEKEGKLRKELEKLKAEMIDTENEMTAETQVLKKDMERLAADKNTLDKHLAESRRELSEQENNLQYFKTMLNTSEEKLEQAADKMEDKLIAMREMAAKDILNQSEIANLKEMLQQQHDKAKQYYAKSQREFEHSAKQLEDSREARRQLEQEKKELVLRLSKIAGANLTYNNPNIADLGDQNRPTKLAEVFSEIYDNEWTDAYETVMDDEEKNKIQFMLKILKDVDRICENVAKRHADAITDGLTQIVVRFKARKGPTDPKPVSDEFSFKFVDTHVENPASTNDILATGKLGNPSAVNQPINNCYNDPSSSNKSNGEQGDALAMHENLAKENKDTNPNQSENGIKVNQLKPDEEETADSNKTDGKHIDTIATEKTPSRNNENISTTQSGNRDKVSQSERGENEKSDSNKTDKTATEENPPIDNANITTQNENGAQEKRLETGDNDSSTSNTTYGKQIDETATDQKHPSEIESTKSIHCENGAKDYKLESCKKESSTSNKTKSEHTDEKPTDETSASENESTNSIQSKNGTEDIQLDSGEKESSAPNNTNGEKSADSVTEEKPPTDNASFNCMENKQEDEMLVLCDKNKSTSNKTDDELSDKADTKHPLDNENINQVQTKSEDENSKIQNGASGQSSVIQDNGWDEQERIEKGAEVDSKLGEDKGEEVDKYTTTPDTEQEDPDNKEKEKEDGALSKCTVIQDNGRERQECTENEAAVDSELGEGKDEDSVDKDTTTTNIETEDADYMEEKIEYEERSDIIQFKFDELPTAQKQYIEDIRRKVQNDLAGQVIKAVGNAVLEEMGPNQTDEIRNYILKCSLFCWTARSHNPPVYVDFMEVTENMRFDVNVYKPYTKTGPFVDYIVWPPIYLHKGGPMLAKGVAQGKKN